MRGIDQTLQGHRRIDGVKFPPVVYGIEARERGGGESGDISGRNESLGEAAFPHIVVHAGFVFQSTIDRREAFAGEIEVGPEIGVSSALDIEADLYRTIGGKNAGGNAGGDGPIPDEAGINKSLVGGRREGNFEYRILNKEFRSVVPS